MKTKEDLKKTFIICYNKEDWEKAKLIISSYIRPISFPWKNSSTYQYINISDYLYGIGWDTSEPNNIETYTRGYKQISLEELFTEF